MRLSKYLQVVFDGVPVLADLVEEGHGILWQVCRPPVLVQAGNHHRDRAGARTLARGIGA